MPAVWLCLYSFFHCDDTCLLGYLNASTGAIAQVDLGAISLLTVKSNPDTQELM